MRISSVVALVSVTLLASRLASADGSDHDRAVASFEDARKLIDEGNCAAAMPKLEDSLRYEASIGARLSMADCIEGRDALAAWTQLREAERLAYLKHDDRVKVAHDRAVTLEAKLAMVHVIVAPATLQEPGFALAVDGRPVDPYFFAEGSIALAPGEHLVEATASDRKWSQTVTTREGSIASIAVRLEKVAPIVAPPLREPDAPPSRGGGQRAAGLIVGGVGIAGLLGGAAFGIVALTRRSDIDVACGGASATCTAPPGSLDGVAASQSTYARLSTLAFVVGGVAFVAGLTLYLTAPRSPTRAAVTAMMTPGGAAFGFTGAW